MSVLYHKRSGLSTGLIPYIVAIFAFWAISPQYIDFSMTDNPEENSKKPHFSSAFKNI